MRIDSSGRVGIGTTSLTGGLNIKGDTPSGDGGSIYLQVNNNNSTDRCGIIRFGNNVTNTTSAISGETVGGNQNGELRFFTRDGSSVQERMRITSSGLLQIRTHSNSASSPTIALKDESSDTAYNTGVYTPTVNLGQGIGFTIAGSQVLECRRGFGDPWVRPGDDNSTNLGNSSRRWKQLYAGTTTINTSDENQKQQIATLTDAEITAATAISKLFRTYKWNDAVEEKGDNARTHTGVIAQQVKQAMTDAGLDAANYAFFCSDTWWTDTVTEDDHTYTVDYFYEDQTSS